MSEAGFASLGPTLLARKGGAKPAMRPQVAPLVADEAEIAALADEQLEDLGWNDMGDGESDSDSNNVNGADVVPINAAVAASESATSESPIIRRQQRRLEERVLAEAAMTGPEDESEETSDLSATDAGYAFDAADEEGYEEAEDEGEDYGDDYNEAAYAPIAPAPAPAPAPIATHAARKVPAQRVLNRKAQSNNERRAAFTLRLDPERHLKLRLAATMQGVSAQVLLTEALDAMLAEYDDLDLIAAHLKRH